ncbi:hypothetical protein [Virgibacillus siamensis]|uniref:hypothetical protein n=1 Tax=Virgibacillus siamensis TaxID=480071 RepID=UPI00098794C7|nr:hypothetical protein [Virgibacillus siamensis]
MVTKILKGFIFLFGFALNAIAFFFYMAIVGDSVVPDTIGDMMLVHSILFLGTFSLIIGVFLVKNLIIRIVVAIIFIIMDLIHIDIFMDVDYGNSSKDLANVQLQYAFILHCSFVLVWVVFLIIQSQWSRKRKLRT